MHKIIKEKVCWKNIAPISATSRFFVVNYKNMKVYCSCIELLLLLFKSRATRFVALYWNEFESCKRLEKSLKNQLDSNFFPSLQPEQSLPRVIKLITTHYEELQKQFPYGRQIGAHETGAQKRTYNIDDILIFTIWLIG